MAVARQLRLFWIGMAVYCLSFCLVALGETSASPGTQPFFGFYCAYFAFFYPWVEARDVLIHHVPPVFKPLEYVTLLVSGWINPVFLLAAFLDLAEARPRLVSILKTTTVAMIPFAWFFAFYELRTYPREGHFLWIIGMLLALYSEKSSTSRSS